MSDKVHSIVAKVFSIPISDITDESGPETIESWDSFNGLILVDELEKNFDIKFSIIIVLYLFLNSLDVNKPALNFLFQYNKKLVQYFLK